MAVVQIESSTLPIATDGLWVRLAEKLISPRAQRLSLMATDLFVVLAALLASHAALLLVRGSVAMELTPRTATATAVMILLWLTVTRVRGTYAHRHLRAGVEEYKRVIKSSATAAGLFGVGCFVMAFSYPRALFLLWAVIGVTGLCLARLARRRITHRLHRHGLLLTPVLVAGADHLVDGIARVLVRERWIGYKVLGAVTTEEQHATALGLPVLGSVDNIVDIIRKNRVRAVIFAEGAFENAEEFRRLGWKLEDSNVQMIVVPTLADISAQRLEFRPVGGLPFVDVARPQAVKSLRWIKRAADITASALLLVLASPLLLLTALMVKLCDGGQVLFRQRRVGLHGEEFDCLKFRSMCLDAEEKLADLQDRNEGAGVLFKMAKDPRVTPIGRFIRRYSIDELPQLWNTLRGDMSLVGPRPALPSEVEQYDSDAKRRLDVRPGLTGLWQVSGRSSLSWDETVRLDLYYVDNWSMVQDLIILSRTARAVLSSAGAY